jgi:hypothetical protein
VLPVPLSRPPASQPASQAAKYLTVYPYCKGTSACFLKLALQRSTGLWMPKRPGPPCPHTRDDPGPRSSLSTLAQHTDPGPPLNALHPNPNLPGLQSASAPSVPAVNCARARTHTHTHTHTHTQGPPPGSPRALAGLIRSGSAHARLPGLEWMAGGAFPSLPRSQWTSLPDPAGFGLPHVLPAQVHCRYLHLT